MKGLERMPMIRTAKEIISSWGASNVDLKGEMIKLYIRFIDFEICLRVQSSSLADLIEDMLHIWIEAPVTLADTIIAYPIKSMF